MHLGAKTLPLFTRIAAKANWLDKYEEPIVQRRDKPIFGGFLVAPGSARDFI